MSTWQLPNVNDERSGVRVMQFRATCRSCGQSFPVPLLSDQQSYGEFILRGTRGRGAAYLNSFTEPAWDVIAAIVDTRRSFPQRVSRVHADLLQRVIGACADPIDGERLTLGAFVCPNCLSSDVSYGDGDPMGVVELPSASFAGFMSLSPEQRSACVASILDGAH